MRKKALCYFAVKLNAITMKKALFISLCVLLLAGSGCKKNAEPEPQKVAVTGVAVIPRSVTLKVGETKEIIATITPANADNQNVSWSTSNSSVATVTNGLITAVSAGEATITATTADGGKTATCAVTVTAVYVPVTGITIDQGATAEVEEGKTITLTATVQPDNATDKTVTWSSSNDAIATVVNGVVTGVTPGEAVITAKAGDKTATCTVTVNSAIPAYEAVDLGLSVKWANKNLGAEFPENTGDYYAWGELETKPVYSWNSYKFLTAEGGYIPKYTMDAWEAATVDYLTLLEEEDDVAHKILGDKWRLPTPAEWNELHNHTNRQNSQNGMYAKASNGNSIFLPYGGMYYSNDGAELYLKGREGFYWTSSLGNINSYARCAWLAGGDINMSIYIVRSAGLAIRAVYGERPPMPVGYVGLDNTSWEMYPEDQFTLVATVLPESAADKTVTWTSSKPEVATVDGGVVTGVAPGEAVITAKAGDRSATCSVVVHTVLPDGAVDLGIVMTREDGSIYPLFWAECNLGASKPEEYGDYYAWGETETKSNYSWSTYKWANGDSWKLTKYCPTDKTDYWDGTGSPDGKEVLDPEDDVAHVKLGGKWRMPTDAEWTALRNSNNCAWTWTAQNGVNGYLVTSKKNGNSIFLPAAGFRYDTYLSSASANGYYWYSSLSTEYPVDAWFVNFYWREVYRDRNYRYYGFSVRPVTE